MRNETNGKRLRRANIEVDLRKDDRRASIPNLALLCMLFGVWGAEFIVLGLPGMIECNKVMVVAVSTIECIVLHAMYKSNVKMILAFVGAMLIVCEHVLFVNYL